MERVYQAYVAPSIGFFREGLFDLYNLVDYTDPNEPALFFGASQSSELIEQHRGYKIVLPSSPRDFPKITNFDKCLMICSNDYELPRSVIRKSITPRIKDYSIFNPSTFGDKIYFYSGFRKSWTLFDDIILEIQKRIPYKIITTYHNDLTDFYDIKFLKEYFYDISFLNLNFSNGHALSTSIEMGLMGRKTIFKRVPESIQRLDFPNFIYYETIDDIIRIIEEESKKIGTIQDPIDAHNVGDEWLNLNYWL